nr:NADH dehydrogenase subunit 2 [Labrisomus nuchipinnis]
MSSLPLLLLTMAIAFGTTLAFTSTHWLLAWMGLEINTLAILPLMTKTHTPRAVEAATKYFLTQAASTAVLLFAATLNAFLTGQWIIMDLTDPICSTLIILALGLKLGMAPLHAWLPDVMQGLEYSTGLVVATWQKFAPVAMLLQIHHASPTLVLAIGLLSTLIGGWGGLNQTQVRKILAYSSIAHLGWLTLVYLFMPSLSILALATYTVTTCSAFLIFNFTSAKTIASLSISWAKTPALIIICPLVLLSLGGLPPLTGFAPKWLILITLVQTGASLLGTIAALTALFSLYYYLRVSYAIALTIAPHTLSGLTPWRVLAHRPPLPLALTTVAATCLLPLVPLAVVLAMN